MRIEAVLMIGFGGPERPEDIRPFLKNVARGRRIPEERLDEVARHYDLMGGRSPLNELTFRQARALQERLRRQNHHLPVYVGMRNWHPFLADTIGQMHADGITRAAGLIMAPQRSDSGWDQYQRNVRDAVAQAGAALAVEYAAPVFNHPLFIEAVADRVRQGLVHLPPQRAERTCIVFTAHSIPARDLLAEQYVRQLNVSASLVARRLGRPEWRLAYQSRSGPPQDPWLQPDINDQMRSLALRGFTSVVLAPIGFVCDHVEVLYDLDIEAAKTAKGLGLPMCRARTVNDDDLFIHALADVITRRSHVS